MSITLADIRMALPDFTKEELLGLNSELCAIIKHKRASASHEAIQNFRVGDKVEWIGYKDQQKYTGVVTKINRTRIVVQPDHQSRKINGSAYMFTKCEPAFDPTTGAWN